MARRNQKSLPKQKKLEWGTHLTLVNRSLYRRRCRRSSIPSVQSGLTFWMKISFSPLRSSSHVSADSPEEAMPAAKRRAFLAQRRGKKDLWVGDESGGPRRWAKNGLN